MSLARKTLAKYGAKIPVAPSTGAKKQIRQGNALPKAGRDTKKRDDKKR